ncbi:MAG TPA: futalosine hydrolase [Bacteroidia bacterium]|jgi:futalosine hydrolase|nr:futalosine hydrolase [Bacteroidia bacterium]HRG53193.1 futalosine hydrolase [Bacteroidia bacterium]
MKILIVAATKFEINPLLNQTEINAFAENSRVIKTMYKKIEIDFLITGVGMVATSFYTAKVLNKNYDLAINMGICGTFNNNLDIGSVVHVYEDQFAEMGAEDGMKFLSMEDLKLEAITKITNKDSLEAHQILALLPKVNGITVNKVHGNEKSIQKIVNRFHPIVESMEGAAFMFACEQEQIPYFQIRAVSNLVERRNKNNWNIPLAIENLNKKIVNFLDSI